MTYGGPVFRWRAEIRPEAGAHGVDWGVTDRFGGVSTGVYGELNLGAHVGDDPQAVRENRTRLATAMDVAPRSLQFMHQQHGADITVVTGATGQGERDGPDTVGVCDGQVTAEPGVALVVLVADCTPVLLVDRVAGLAAAVHAGRPGMVAGVVPAAVERLRDLGARSLEAVVGPSVCGRCYEVPAAMRATAAAVSPASAALSWAGTPAIDVATGVVDQLSRHGVAVRWLPGCARESPDLYSHRRSGTTGRYAGVVRLLPALG